MQIEGVFLFDANVLGPWIEHGFEAEDACAWLRAAPGRFTPVTARLWVREGFGPADAALWSEVFADPLLARRRRNAGHAGPFPDD